jgi:hypothetical protein
MTKYLSSRDSIKFIYDKWIANIFGRWHALVLPIPLTTENMEKEYLESGEYYGSVMFSRIPHINQR